MAHRGDICEFCNSGRLVVGSSTPTEGMRTQIQKLKCNKCKKYAKGGTTYALRESILPRTYGSDGNRIT